MLTELRDVLGSKPFKHIEQAEQVVDPTERLWTKRKNATPPLRQQLFLCVCVCVSRAACLRKRSSFLAEGNSIPKQQKKSRSASPLSPIILGDGCTVSFSYSYSSALPKLTESSSPVSELMLISSLVRICCALSSKPRPTMKPFCPSAGGCLFRTYSVASSSWSLASFVECDPRIFSSILHCIALQSKAAAAENTLYFSSQQRFPCFPTVVPSLSR
jgi:hypothetical protein